MGITILIVQSCPIVFFSCRTPTPPSYDWLVGVGHSVYLKKLNGHRLDISQNFWINDQFLAVEQYNT